MRAASAFHCSRKAFGFTADPSGFRANADVATLVARMSRRNAWNSSSVPASTMLRHVAFCWPRESRASLLFRSRAR